MATFIMEINEKTSLGQSVLSHLKSLNINVRKEKSLTAAQEKEAFFYTSKINAAKAFSKHL